VAGFDDQARAESLSFSYRASTIVGLRNYFGPEAASVPNSEQSWRVPQMVAQQNAATPIA